MIKFVCASCGERLSVPDQGLDRDIECPVCNAINRVKRSGDSAPPAAAEAVAETPVAATPVIRNQKIDAPAPLSPKPRIDLPRKDSPDAAKPPASKPAKIAATKRPASSSRRPDMSTAPEWATRIIPPAEPGSSLSGMKIVLLILAVLTIVGGLYFGLLLILRVAVPEGSGPQ